MSIGTLLIRADASVPMGTGHVMRCLALAQAWQDFGGSCVFAMAEATPSVRETILRAGVGLRSIASRAGSAEDARETILLTREGVKWIVMDGYHFDSSYQLDLKKSGCRLLMVDDTGRADHYWADIVVNQNPNASAALYERRESETTLLLGLKFAMLRREFEFWRKRPRDISASGRKILITMGGSDPDNMSLVAVEALRFASGQGWEVVIAMGGSNPHRKSLEDKKVDWGPHFRSLTLHQDVTNMPELMWRADMAVLAAGGTLWELLFMGCPLLSCARNADQFAIVSYLEQAGVAVNLGLSPRLDAGKMGRLIEELSQSAVQREEMSERGMQMVDGKGAKRICEKLMTFQPGNVTA